MYIFALEKKKMQRKKKKRSVRSVENCMKWPRDLITVCVCVQKTVWKTHLTTKITCHAKPVHLRLYKVVQNTEIVSHKDIETENQFTLERERENRWITKCLKGYWSIFIRYLRLSVSGNAIRWKLSTYSFYTLLMLLFSFRVVLILSLSLSYIYCTYLTVVEKNKLFLYVIFTQANITRF